MYLNDLLPGWDVLLGYGTKVWHTHFTQAMFIILAAYCLRRFGIAIIKHMLDRAVSQNAYHTNADHQKRVRTLLGIFTAVMSFAIIVIAGMMIIQLFGIPTGSLLASASILGVAIGFGTQTLVKDFVTGIFIIIENQYRVGDEVTLGNYTGTVEAIGIRTTVLRDADGNVHYVPNGSIVTATNKTLNFTRINLNITVIYETDIKKIEKIINKVGEDMSNDPQWGKRIIDPPRFQRVDNFAGNGIEIKIVGTTKPTKLLDIVGELRRRLLIAFTENDITIPHPPPPPPKEDSKVQPKKSSKK